jgi:hypothetical protein
VDTPNLAGVRSANIAECSEGSIMVVVLQCHAPFAVDVQPSALVADLEPR